MRRGIARITILLILSLTALQGALAHVACPNCANSTDQNCGTYAPAPQQTSCCGAHAEEPSNTGLAAGECVCGAADAQAPAHCPKAFAPSPSSAVITTHAVVEAPVDPSGAVGLDACAPPRAGDPVFHGGRSPPS